MPGGLTRWRGPLASGEQGPPIAAVPLALGAAAVLAAGGGAASVGVVAPAGALAAIALYAAVALAILATIETGHPFARFGPANSVTLTRAVLNALLVGLVVESALSLPSTPDGAASSVGWIAAALALGSLGLDGIDGRLARRTGLVSRFGARFDVEVDALLVLALATLAAVGGKVGAWVLVAGLAYYAFMAAKSVWPRLDAKLQPSRIRRCVFVVQATALLIVVLPPVAPAVAKVSAGVATVFVAASFARDVAWLLRRRSSSAGPPSGTIIRAGPQH